MSTCLALHVPRCFVALCTHLFQGLPSLSLHLPQPLSPSLPHPALFPTADLLFSCGIWDPIQRAHYSVLILSRGWAPSGRMGDYAPPPHTHLTNPLFSPCHAMMSWLLFALRVHADSLSVLHTPYLPLPVPYPH